MSDNPERFTGISEFNDNNRVHEYLNMIPMGTTCIDRLGCDLIAVDGNSNDSNVTPYNFNSAGMSYGEFVDSLGFIWILKHKNLYGGCVLFRLNGAIVQAAYLLGGGNDILQKPKYVKFLEDTISPQRIYMLVVTQGNDYLYTWQVQKFVNDYRLPAFKNQRPVRIKNFCGYQPRVLDDGTIVYANSQNRQPRISDISWYDNRLVFTDTGNNIVWLSATSPWQRFWQYGNDSIQDLNANPPVYGRWSKNNADLAVPNWYGSTNNPDLLNQAIAYAGQLYFLFNHTIERWSRTGIEDSPIQFNTNGTLLVGGSEAIAINDAMYFVGKDSNNVIFVGLFTSNGQFTRISNSEIERRIELNQPTTDIVSQRNDTFCMVTIAKGEHYCVNQRGWWWRFDDDDDETILRTVLGDLVITSKGNLARFTNNHRISLNGKGVFRAIRERYPYNGINSRRVLSALALVCDTGLVGDNSAGEELVIARASFNQGLTWGKPSQIKLGKRGQNDKAMIFRNLGSGSSVLYEISTRANAKLQIYDIQPKLL